MNALEREGAALYAAYAATLEDAPRCAFTDWCEDHDPARAELITVQSELAGIEPNTGALNRVTALGLRDRIDALLAANRASWLRVECKACGGDGERGIGRCLVCNGTGDAGGLTWPQMTAPNDLGDGMYSQTLVRVTWRNGFPAVVEVPRLADCVTVCPRCEGTGRAYGADRPFEGGATATCPVCKGDRHAPTDWLRAVVTHHPCAVVPLDREPFRYMDDPGKFGWARDRPTYNDDPRNALPPAIWDLLPPGNVYDTRDPAIAALGLKLRAFGRDPSPPNETA